MVNFDGMWNFFDADCCKVEVVNGANGLRLVSLVSRFETLYFAPSRPARISSALPLSWMSILSMVLSPTLASLASNSIGSFLVFLTVATISQYSWGLNAKISRSRSATRRTATDCTRPADRPLATLCHKKGESL